MKTDKKSASFLSQILIYGLGLALNYGIGFILLPVYSRLMPEADYGRLEIINRTMEVISLLFLTQYGITYIRFYRDKTDEAYRKLVTSTCLYVVMAVSGVIALAISLFSGSLSSALFSGPELGHYFVLGAGRYFAQMMFVVPFLYFQATEQPVKYVIISAANLVTTLSLNIILLYTMDDKVAAVLWANILGPAIFVVTVGGWVYLHSSRKLDWHITKEIIHFSWSFTFLGIYSFVMNSGGHFFINKFWGAAEVGVYAAGYKIAQVLNTFIFSPIIRAWNAKMVDVLREPEGTKFLARLTTYALMLYVTLGVTVAIYCREVVSVVMDPRYFACYTIIPAIILAYSLDGFQMFADTAFYYTKKTYLKMWHGVTTAVSIGLYFILIPQYRMYGAAWATVGTYVFFAGLTWVMAERIFPTHFELGKMFRIGFAAICVYLVNLYLEHIEVSHFMHVRVAARMSYPWIYLMAVLLLKSPLLLVYALLIKLLHVIEPKDRERIKDFYLSLRSKIGPRNDKDIPPRPEPEIV